LNFTVELLVEKLDMLNQPYSLLRTPYDLATRARLHPAYLAGVVWMIALQITALVLLGNPTWKALSLHLIGH